MIKIKLLQDLLREVQSLQFNNFDEDKITNKAKLYIKKCFGAKSDYIEQLNRINFTPSIYYSGMPDSDYYESFENGKKCLDNLISTMIEDLELSIDETDHSEKQEVAKPQRTNLSQKIFVVHGHDENKRVEIEAFLRSIDYEPIVLFKEPNKGKTIIEKIEDHVNDVCYAIVLYAPCDLGRDKDKGVEQPRARQNVVFEHGYMCAKLGRDHVCALYAEGVELPGDMSGVIYTEYDEVGMWKYSIAKEMNAVGLPVDMNKIR
jgi:predicted nucleotide-binding protein